MRFWGLKSCDTCRKALKELRQSGVEPEVIDVRADSVAPADIARFYAAFQADLLNRRSTTWRGLSADERAGDALVLLADHPTLMKRPVIEVEGQLFLGWNAQQRDQLLGIQRPTP